MAGKSNIEWTERTWNPIVGCSIVSPGCTNCYAMKMAARIQKINVTGGSNSNYVNHYDGTTKVVNGKAVWTGHLAKAPDKILLQPLSRKAPTTYFVNSMSDLFHENVPDEWIDAIFAVMALTPWHTYQVLTKRADRMRAYVSSEASARVRDWCYRPERHFSPGKDPTMSITTGWPERWKGWPLPNVWLGVSTEDQKRADERIPLLLETPAAIRFISAEPLLGPINLHRVPNDFQGEVEDWPRLDWVIVGGESGPRYRPMKPEWAWDIVKQCSTAGVPVFVKQMAGKKPIPVEMFVRETPLRVTQHH